MRDVVGGGGGVAGYRLLPRPPTVWRGRMVGMAGGTITRLGSESGKFPSVWTGDVAGELA